jgi:MYXO-CTERM domain-containing protein
MTENPTGLFATVVVSLGLSLSLASSAHAAEVLFVSDHDTDSNIVTVLQGDGHTVTVVLNDYNVTSDDNPTLRGDLSGYDLVVWSASGNGEGGVHIASVMANLEAYVTAGGYVYVTGHDAVDGPIDLPLAAFLGSADPNDLLSPDNTGPCITTENDLLTGVVDIRGVTPSGFATDIDSLEQLAPDTIGVCPEPDRANTWQWTLRTLGDGKIAFVANGSNAATHPSWEDTSAGGAGAYNASIRNFAANAGGANVLFVSDLATDTNIPAALLGDDHRVEEVLNDYAAGDNPALRADLSDYDAVVWSATGGAHTNAAVFANLTTFAMTGGLVLVTGHDSVTNPSDSNLIALVGASSASDLPGAPTAATSATTLLTVPVVDIRGVAPSGGATNRDALLGLGADSAEVVGTSGSAGSQWTVRRIGLGRIAYVSNGAPGPTSAHPSWTTTTAGGLGAYNAALRNFAEAASSGLPGVGLLGSTCSADTDCEDGFCTDGVCCDTRCGDSNPADCQACSRSAGAANDGLCGALDLRTAIRTICRPGSDACDFPETCVVGSTTCPPDGVRAAGAICRTSTGDCDAAERCDGSSSACPADTVSPAGTVCRPAGGACDVEEACNGTSGRCPADAFVSADTECRPVDGVCDVAEMCTGLRASCPVDRFAGPTVVCREAAQACDAPDVCAGFMAACPPDMAQPDGFGCDNGMECDGADVCMTGVCISPGNPCDDGNVCTADLCDDAGGCSYEPVEGCCLAAADCSDDDPCTRDLCTENTCVYDPICDDAGAPGGDGGVGSDAGAASDGGARDSGTEVTPPDEGCGCAAGSGRSPLVSLLLVLGVLGAIRRRRRR